MTKKNTFFKDKSFIFYDKYGNFHLLFVGEIKSRYWPFDRDFFLYNLLKSCEDEKLPIL